MSIGTSSERGAMEKSYYRSIWISDTHLGGADLQNQKLFEFLTAHDSEYLYLVGDIFDLWKLRFRWSWPAINDQIVTTIMNKAANGTKVYYLPGNHDELLRKYCGLVVNNISVVDEIMHETANGQKYMILHGDKFDCVVQKKKWLAGLGSISYDLLLVINRWYNFVRAAMGKPYHSISASIKHRVKKAVNYIGDFEDYVIKEAREHNVDGLICGHIHHPTVRDIEGVLYCNAGDWVESCTALVENLNGTVGNIHWQNVSPVRVTQAEKKHYEDRYRDRRLAPSS